VIKATPTKDSFERRRKARSQGTQRVNLIDKGKKKEKLEKRELIKAGLFGNLAFSAV